MTSDRKSKRWPVIVAGMLMVLAACGPSQIYRDGRGFYSEEFSPGLVRTAAKAGKVTTLGPFSFEASSCGNYSTGRADQHLIVETLRGKIPTLGANAAQKVRATEDLSSFFFSLLMLPMGCSDWTISGEALLVDHRAFEETPTRR